MSAVDIFSIIRDVVLAIAAGTTAYVAYTGLEKWQKELRGKANFEVARILIKSVYKLRDEIWYCRSPFISAHEFPESYSGVLGKHTSEEDGQAWAHVYSKRWEPIGVSIQEFDAAILEAEALWGVEIKDKAVELRHAANELRASIESVISNKYSGGESFKRNKDFGDRMEANINAITSDDDNELTKKIDTAITGLESDIRPHLSRS